MGQRIWFKSHWKYCCNVLVFVFYNICKLMVSFFFRPPNPIEYLAAYLLKNKNQFEWCRILGGGSRWGVGQFSLCELVTVFMHSSVICVSTVSFYVNVINILTYKNDWCWFYIFEKSEIDGKVRSIDTTCVFMLETKEVLYT